MKRLLLLLLLCSPSLLAQTTVNMTVQDTPDNQTWNSAVWTVQLAPPNLAQGASIISGGGSLLNQTGVLSGTGTGSVILPANSNIAPQGTFWKFTFCPPISIQCYNTNVVVTPSSPQTTTIQPPSPRMSAGPGQRAYANGEVSGGLGSEYYNVTSNNLLVCTSFTTSCLTWSSSAGGSGNVNGPSSSTAVDVTGFGDTTGKNIVDTGILDIDLGLLDSGLSATQTWTGTNIFGGQFQSMTVNGGASALFQADFSVVNPIAIDSTNNSQAPAIIWNYLHSCAWNVGMGIGSTGWGWLDCTHSPSIIPGGFNVFPSDHFVLNYGLDMQATSTFTSNVNWNGTSSFVSTLQPAGTVNGNYSWFLPLANAVMPQPLSFVPRNIFTSLTSPTGVIGTTVVGQCDGNSGSPITGSYTVQAADFGCTIRFGAGAALVVPQANSTGFQNGFEVGGKNNDSSPHNVTGSGGSTSSFVVSNGSNTTTYSASTGFPVPAGASIYMWQDSSNNWQVSLTPSASGGNPAGPNGAVQYNNNGLLGAFGTWTPNGPMLTLPKQSVFNSQNLGGPALSFGNSAPTMPAVCNSHPCSIPGWGSVFGTLEGSYIQTSGVKVSQLPAAAGAVGSIIVVNDSTTVATEGQTCAGNSTNTALAFSNGSGWKCF